MLEARRRIVAAAETAVAAAGLDQQLLDGLLSATAVKQPDVRALYELEAIAPIVEALNANLSEAQAALSEAEAQPTAVLEQAVGYLSESDILAIPGLTKTSKEAITAYFEALHAPAE